ncbi:hypothetical protein [Candidatus Poriferisocius sp.]|uniref:hypothetical protein n=1 Tax=Candidatus Poriferisocius sp. TaxID=3101276 RepID=UPI003B01CDAC
MKLEVTNVRGLETGTVELEPGRVQVVRRPNAAGKTTLSACLAACLSRVADPLGLAPRNGLYVRKEAAGEECRAVVSDDTWSVTWEPASATFVTAGNAPEVPEAVLRFGQPLLGGTRRAASRRWLDAILPEPVTAAELAAELETATDQVTAARLAKQAIPADADRDAVQKGFESAWAVADTQCREAKARWADVASAADGERRTYGSAIAAKWRPKGWTAELEGRGLAELEERLHDATEAERLLAAEAARLDEQVRNAERVRQDHEAELVRISGLRMELETAQEAQRKKDGGEVEALRTEFRQAEAARDEAEQGVREGKTAMERARQAGEAAERDAARAAELRRRVQDTRARNERWQREHVRTLRGRVDDGENRLEEAEQKVADLKKSMLLLESADLTCETCGQGLPPALNEKRRAQSLEKLRSRLDSAQRRREHCEESLDEARSELADAENDDATPPGIQDMLDEIANLEAKADEAEESPGEAIARWREEISRRTDAYGRAEREFREVGSRLEKVVSAATFRREAVENIGRLQGRIEEAEKQIESGLPEAPSDAECAEASRRKLIAADVQREAAEAVRVRHAYEEAARAQEEALQWDRVRTILSPDKGIQARKLYEGEAVMQEAMEIVARTVISAGSWLPQVRIDTAERRILVNGLPVEAASNAERWWAETACRLGLAAVAKSPVAIIDGADVIGLDQRKGYLDAAEVMADEYHMAVLWTETE